MQLQFFWNFLIGEKTNQFDWLTIDPIKNAGFLLPPILFLTNQRCPLIDGYQSKHK
jgi:hypothetical protein